MNPELFDALENLVDACAHKTGQGYKLRALLYSLWNGKPASILEIVSLDWNLRQQFLIVCAGFGQRGFFYDEIKSAFVRRGLFDWFCEEGENK